MRYLIVGGGIAGTTAAEELRQLDPDSQIVLLSEESHRLYSRVLLPFYVSGQIEREKCFLKRPAWYAERGIEVKFGARAQRLDLTDRQVETSDGRSYPFDKLLITTGGAVTRPFFEHPAISYLRTIDDADRLFGLLQKPHERAGIIGGGFIAMDLVNLFAGRPFSTRLFLRREKFFSQAFDQEASDLLRFWIEESGLVVSPSVGEVKMTDQGPSLRLDFGEEEWGCSLLGVGVGIVPDLSWLAAAGIKVSVGVRVNEYLETNVPNVLAAGDVAEFFDLTAGRHRLVGNWTNAMLQARTAARTMAGERTIFSLVSSYTAKVGSRNIIFIGDTNRSTTVRVERRGSKEEDGLSDIFYRDGRPVGAVILNRTPDRRPLTEMIQSSIKKI